MRTIWWTKSAGIATARPATVGEDRGVAHLAHRGDGPERLEQAEDGAEEAEQRRERGDRGEHSGLAALEAEFAAGLVLGERLHLEHVLAALVFEHRLDDAGERAAALRAAVADLVERAVVPEADDVRGKAVRDDARAAQADEALQRAAEAEDGQQADEPHRLAALADVVGPLLERGLVRRLGGGGGGGLGGFGRNGVRLGGGRGGVLREERHRRERGGREEGEEQFFHGWDGWWF